MIAFNRGKRVSATLSEMWMIAGAYTTARQGLDNAPVQDQLLAGGDDTQGLHVMTIHKFQRQTVRCRDPGSGECQTGRARISIFAGVARL